MIGKIGGNAASINGKDALRDGRAMPSSMVFCYDATQGNLAGLVPDLTGGAPVIYPSTSGLSFDSTGRMVGVDYGFTPTVVDPGRDVSTSAGDSILLLACGAVVDSHIPQIKFSTDNSSGNSIFGCDAFGIAHITGNLLIVAGSEFPPHVIEGDPGAIGYLDGQNMTAHRYDRSIGDVDSNIGVEPPPLVAFNDGLYLGPSSTGEAFSCMMRWASGNQPPVAVVQDGMRWMWHQWLLGNYTIYPPLLLY